MQTARNTLAPAVWNSIISTLPNPHLLQTYEWAEVKKQLGWEPFYLVWCTTNGSITFYTNQWPADAQIKAAALVLQRSLAVGKINTPFRVLYAPKGPLLNWQDRALFEKVIADLQRFCKQQHAIFLKFDPDLCLGVGYPSEVETIEDANAQAVQKLLESTGWCFSNDQIQFRNTILVDLTGSEAELLERMKQKTRYNIRLASRKGVTIRLGSENDYPMLYKMYAETSVRDGFIIRDEDYYHTVWSTFAPLDQLAQIHPYAQPLIAEVAGEPVAALILFIFASRAWYLYGMSCEQHREKMPNYLLQWEAIRFCKAAGCHIYDLWGAPDVFADTDPLWGVYRFKEGLGGTITRFLGAWDYPNRPGIYTLYTYTLPRLLAFMRRRGQKKIRALTG